MSAIENFSRARRRAGVTTALRPFLPFEVQSQQDSLARAEVLSREGYGIIVFVPHFSKGEFPRVVGALSTASPVFREKDIVAPIATHQQNTSGLQGLVRMTDITLLPVVTSDTKEKEEKFCAQAERNGKSLDEEAYAIMLNLAPQAYKPTEVTLFEQPGDTRSK